MPRPKSELTGQQGFTSVRLTEVQRELFRQLGGAAWLREQLSNILEGNVEKEETDAERARRLVAVHAARSKAIPKVRKTTWHP